MSNIQRRLTELQAPTIPPWFGKVTVRTTCDTAIGMTRSYCVDLSHELKHMGAHLIIKDSQWNWKYHVTRPKFRHFKPLAEYAEWRNRFDIAYDFESEDDNALEDCYKWLANRVNLNWKTCAKRWYHGLDGTETLYWEDTEHVAGMPDRCLALYKKFAPLAIRLELRCQCTPAVRVNGLDDWSPTGLKAINPRTVAEKHFRPYDLNEAWLQSMRQWSKYRRLPVAEMDRHIDRYRAEVSVFKGVVHPLPKEAYAPVAPVVSEAFFNLIPTRLQW